MRESSSLAARTPAPSESGADAAPIAPVAHYERVRHTTADLVSTLAPEDTVAQSMPQASPAKWHLAHTTWFFEQFVLARDPSYRPLHPEWSYLFNSYYQSVGPMHSRPLRGLLTRPTLAEVVTYRERVDARMHDLLDRVRDPQLAMLVTLGLNHEQQHQELLLTDIKHLFSLNPLEPVYRRGIATSAAAPSPMTFLAGSEGIVEIGHAGDGFAFDAEMPRHRALLHSHAIADRPVTNSEFREFVADRGYRTPTLWLSEGWETVQREGWKHPLYWSEDLATEFTLAGRMPLDPHAPVCHVSFFEADAFARWAGARLPTESEWESMAVTVPVAGNLLESGILQPQGAAPVAGPRQFFGDVWEWTASPYVSYPGYRPLPGALGEYNGKFMSGQQVLRGGSCATPGDHVRATYRNFFAPAERWQFMGLRLGRDA